MKCILNILTMFVIAGYSLAVDYIVPETANKPVVDGVISAGEWTDALKVTMVYPAITQSPNQGAIPPGFTAPDNAADLSADCYLTWDNDNIYVAFRVYDQTLCWIDDQPLYDGASGDMAQFCFAPLGKSSTIYDFVVDTLGSAGPSYSDRGGLGGVAEMTGTALSDGYIIEAAISWSQLGVTPSYGQIHRCGFVLIDTDNSSSWDVLMADFSNNGVWATFGTTASNTMKLVSADGCGISTMNTSDLNSDCKTNLEDMRILAQHWSDCTDPANSACY